MIALLIGLMFAGALLLAFLATRRIAAAVPQDNRQYMDPPPRFFRLTWPLVRLVAHYLGWTCPARMQSRIQETLRRSGQDYSLTPVQFFAGKLIAAVLTGAAVSYMTVSCGFGIPLGVAIGGVLGFIWPDRWLGDMTRARNLKILKGLPFFLDIVTMAVEAGMNLSSALQKAAEKIPPGPLVGEVNRLLREVRAGKPRADALRD